MFPRILLVNTDCLANVGRPPLLKDITQILQLKRIQELFSKMVPYWSVRVRRRAFTSAEVS